MKFATVKKWLALLLASCMVMALAACGKTADDTGTTGGDTGDTGDTGSSAAKIAVVFASSGLGDKSFNDALFNGMKDAESTMGIEWVYSEPKDDAEYEGLISGYADSGDCDLIICLGGSQSSSLENVAPNYPQQKFVILDAVVEGDNIRSYTPGAIRSWASWPASWAPACPRPISWASSALTTSPCATWALPA